MLIFAKIMDTASEWWYASDFFGDYHLHGAPCSWNAVNDLSKRKLDMHAWVRVLPGAPQIGKWYNLKITTIGDEISFYIDDELKHQTKDAMYSEGGVILYAYNAVVEFDNVVITGDEIPSEIGQAVEPETKLTTTWGMVKK